MMALLAGFYRAFGLFQVSLVFLGSGLVYAENNSSPRFPVGDPRNCLLTNGVYRFEVLPGGGWDNLRNVHMGAVSVMNYSKCKTSDDGKYLIPDDVILYPIKESKVHVFAEMYDHWHNYSSATTKSINAEASGKFGFGSISGSFSSEFESVKKHQVEDKAVTTRTQLRHVLYTAKLQPDAPLQAPFKSRLLEIASHLQHNNTAYANFLAQVLVRDFGTHYVTSVKAGAALAKVDHLTKKFVADFSEDKSKITAAASASFFGVFGASVSYTQTTDKKVLDEYTQNIAYSTVYTFGGPPFRVNFTINKWEDQLLDELVAVDRSGDPLHFAITPGSVPELSEELVFKLANVVEKAIKQYYEHNIIKGCTKMDSPNFSFQANLDDGSCESPTNNYTFGGVYQTCQCEGSPSSNPCGSFLQKNPLTADYSCSNGYEPVMVHQGRTPESCHRECHGWWIFKSCDTHCGFASYDTYWCVAEGSVPRNTGYLFGGLYSNVLKNPVTQDHSCPVRFYALRFGATMQVCVSDDYELGFQQSVPFGGFFSCNTGNPLGVKKAADSAKGSNGLSGLALFVKQSGPSVWPKTCPIGYSQHLGAIEEDCEINFCVKSNIFNSQGFLIIKRPPYSNAPKIYKYTVPLLVVNNDTGHIWFKRSNSPHWVLATKSSVAEFVAETNLDGPAIIGMDPAHDKQNPAHGKQKSSSQSSRDAMGAGAAAGITFGVTALAGLLIAVMVIGWRRHKTIQRESSGLMEPLNPTGYGAVKEEGSPQV